MIADIDSGIRVPIKHIHTRGCLQQIATIKNNLGMLDLHGLLLAALLPQGGFILNLEAFV